MTNREKFAEIFGFKPRKETDCVFPAKVCEVANSTCLDCPLKDWWDHEYKGCFKIREDLQ